MKKILTMALATVAVLITSFSCSPQKPVTTENFCTIAEVDSTFKPSRYGLFNLDTREFRNIEEDDENIDDEMYMATFAVDTELYERILRGNITEEEYSTIKNWAETDASLEDEEYDETKDP